MTDAELERRLGGIEGDIKIIMVSLESLNKNLSDTEIDKSVWRVLHSQDHKKYLECVNENCFIAKKPNREIEVLEIIEKWKNKAITGMLKKFIPISAIIQALIWWVFTVLFK